MKATFEKIEKREDAALHHSIYEDTSFKTPWHFHPELELTFIVKGEGVRYVGNTFQEFQPGDLVLLGANVPHCWKNDTDTGVKSIVFQWQADLLGTDWLERAAFKNIKTLLDTASKGIHFPLEDNEKEQFQKRLEVMESLDAFHKLVAFLKLLEDLSAFKNKKYLITDGFSPNLNIRNYKRVDAVYNYVTANYRNKITLKEACSVLNMGEEGFCRFVKKHMNKSFFTLVNEYRIHRVSKDLIDTNKQVREIAYSCGYESLPFFYKQFQKFMNCSPLQFKKKYLNHISN
ncbi:AraC family transcriptional regulator [Tamlana sp. 2_MG-2023]|uniref:AraC family transcriptional regulator n=1 Tax=unclassified Tamlana TaxID=2614803 RepID=UPI0026E153D2|nr:MULTISPECIES: AraC family transcriptional regulator [unclassified Tamlana]MDO6761303.1 AraC family transcriptional regulator [Tamlana sp. 2_MG-2023]MDO6791786.1 AraC family transcriptional regulator [Tamlana sp. 1_MG-2023]